MSGGQFSTVLLLLAAVLVLAVVFAGLRHSPKLAVVTWLFVVCFVPVWIGVSFRAYFPAFALLGLVTALSLLPSAARVRWSWVDAFFVAIAVLVLVEYFLHLTTRSATFDVFTAWGGSFLFGRVLASLLRPTWVYGAFAVFFTVVSVFALLEFVTGYNPFTTLLANGNPLYSTWGSLQARGAVIRAEGAFGHSIALGSSIGVAVALTMGSRFRPWLKTAMVGVMVAATVVTFSRTGMLTAGLSVLLSCLFLRKGLSLRYRRWMTVAMVVAAGLVLLSIRDVFLASDEAEGSALYRSDLLQLIHYLRPLGLANNYSVSTTSEVSIGTFGSIDNALLLFGLIYGWIPAALLLLLLAAAVGYVLRGRATAPVIAVVALVPAMVTVALITQYAGVVWFTFGMAVGTQVLANAQRRGEPARSSAPAPLPRGAGNLVVPERV